MNTSRIYIIALTLLFIISISSYAKNYYMEIISYTKNSKNESFAINKFFATPTKLKLEHNNIAFILSKDDKELIYVNNIKKNYLKFIGTSLFALDLILPFMVPEKNFQVNSIQSYYDTTKVINSFLCYKTTLTFKNNSKEKPSYLTIWSTRKINTEYSILDIINSVIKYPFNQIKNLSEQISGFPVLIQGNVIFQDDYYLVKYELITIKEINIEDNIFELPANYKSVEFNFHTQ